MRSPPLDELLCIPPTENALAWIRSIKGPFYNARYLKSRLWREIIRPQVLERDNYRCVFCNRAAREVHHLDYEDETLLGLNLSKLKSVCEDHHESAHKNNPKLEFAALSARFLEVQADVDIAKRVWDKFISDGGRMIVSVKPSRVWFSVKFRWDFAPHDVRGFNEFPFYAAASRDFHLSYHRRTPGSVGGTQLKTDAGRPAMIFHWESHEPSDGVIKMRATDYPEWEKAIVSLTSMFPFPILIIDDRGGEIAKSGGYRPPAPPPDKPKKILIQRWTDTELREELDEKSEKWDKYPFGETLIEHGVPYPKFEIPNRPDCDEGDEKIGWY